MIISRTPFRISFFGGGTDFPEFYTEHGGATLSTTIDKYCYISIHVLGQFFEHRFRASYAKTELVQEPCEFQHPLVRECLLFLNINEGIEITHISDLPGQVGLGSSSSFTVGLLHALHAFQGETVSAEQLATEAITVERERVGDAGGRQDQYAAAYGGMTHTDYSADKIAIRRLNLPKRRLLDLEEHLMMFYTGIGQSAQSILREQQDHVERNNKILQEMLQMVDEAERILMGNGEMCEFGKLLHETWARKKTLSNGISNSAIDSAYNAAKEAGASGGKLLGAGGRGFLLFLAKPQNHNAIRQSLRQLQEVPFSFSNKGSHILFQGDK